MRYADVIHLRHNDHEPARQRYVLRNPDAFRAEIILNDLTHNAVARRHVEFLRHNERAVAQSGLVDKRFARVKEGVFFKPDIDKRRFHSLQGIDDFALVNVADDFRFRCFFDVIFLQLVIFGHCDANALRVVVDEEFFHKYSL